MLASDFSYGAQMTLLTTPTGQRTSHGSSSRNQISSITRAVTTDVNAVTFYNLATCVGLADSVTEGKEIYINFSEISPSRSYLSLN